MKVEPPGSRRPAGLRSRRGRASMWGNAQRLRDASATHAERLFGLKSVLKAWRAQHGGTTRMRRPAVRAFPSQTQAVFSVQPSQPRVGAFAAPG
jgi:hypothetical protein